MEAAKLETHKLTAAFEERGSLPPERPLLRTDDLSLYADDKNAVALTHAVGNDRSPQAFLRAHLDRVGSGDYFALLAFIERNASHADQLDAMRRTVRDSRHVATCAGFGPRYLHSTGQVYKGGPNTGVFVLITHEHASDLPIPGHKFTFGIVEAAQARGDFQVLAERDRRILRVHLGPGRFGGHEEFTAASAQGSAMIAYQPEPNEPCNVRLVIADVDGTLVTPQKGLTPRHRGGSQAACGRHRLRHHQWPAATRDEHADRAAADQNADRRVQRRHVR